MPSGYVIHQLPISNGHIAVDLTNGGKGKSAVFIYIDGKDQSKADVQIQVWQREGIECDCRNPNANKLNLQVRDLNDVYFANIFYITFGDDSINRDSEYGIMYICAGFPVGSTDFYFPIINVATPEALPRGIAELQRQARELRKRNPKAEYMRVCTCTKGVSEYSGHAENIDIDRLLALDPNAMKDGEIYWLGNRNWGDWHGIDIPRLAVLRTTGPDGNPTFQFGTVYNAENPCYETQFKPIDLQYFRVYTDEVRRIPGT